jgi:hypothetical protein
MDDIFLEVSSLHDNDDKQPKFTRMISTFIITLDIETLWIDLAKQLYDALPEFELSNTESHKWIRLSLADLFMAHTMLKIRGTTCTMNVAVSLARLLTGSVGSTKIAKKQSDTLLIINVEIMAAVLRKLEASIGIETGRDVRAALVLQILSGK